MRKSSSHKGKVSALLNGVEVPMVTRIDIRENVFQPFPTCNVGLKLSQEFHNGVGLYVGSVLTLRMWTDSSGTEVEMDFHIVSIRELPTVDTYDEVTVAGIACPLGIFALMRRAFPESTPMAILETLYSEMPVFSLSNELPEGTVSEPMDWLQVGSWVWMWNHVLTCGSIGDDDLLLSFCDIDGNAVVTSLSALASDASPVKMEYSPAASLTTQGEKGESVPFHTLYRDTVGSLAIPSFGGLGVQGYDMDAFSYEAAFGGISGARAKGEDKGMVFPVAGYLSSAIFGHTSPASVRRRNAELNARKVGQLLSNGLTVAGRLHPELRLGRVAEISIGKMRDDDQSKRRFDGKWLVRQVYYFYKHGDECVSTYAKLSGTTLNPSAQDTKGAK